MKEKQGNKQEAPAPLIQGSGTADRVTSTWIDAAQATNAPDCLEALREHYSALTLHREMISAMIGMLSAADPRPQAAPWDN